MPLNRLKILALDAQSWPKFERLFGSNGACGGCWCNYWRVARKEYESGKGDVNRNRMRSWVSEGRAMGIMAVDENNAVGWISVEPRISFPGLKTSRIFKPVDDKEVWSVTCFFMDKNWRGKGLSVFLLEAAKTYVKKKGGEILEGYPVEPRKKPMPAAFAWNGLASSFLKSGFSEVARRSATRPIMRFEL